MCGKMKNTRYYWLFALLCMLTLNNMRVSAQERDPLQEFIDSLAREQAGSAIGPRRVQRADIPVDELPILDLSQSRYRNYLSRSKTLSITASVKIINGTISALSSFSGGEPLVKLSNEVTVVLDASAAIDAGNVASNVCSSAVGIYECSTLRKNGDVTAPDKGTGVAIYLDTDCCSLVNDGGDTNGTVDDGSGGILGDVNADGKVDIADAACIVSWLLEQNPPVFVQEVADYNRDGVITASDAVAIVQYVME